MSARNCDHKDVRYGPKGPVNAARDGHRGGHARRGSRPGFRAKDGETTGIARRIARVLPFEQRPARAALVEKAHGDRVGERAFRARGPGGEDPEGGCSTVDFRSEPRLERGQRGQEPAQRHGHQSERAARSSLHLAPRGVRVDDHRLGQKALGGWHRRFDRSRRVGHSIGFSACLAPGKASDHQETPKYQPRYQPRNQEADVEDDPEDDQPPKTMAQHAPCLTSSMAKPTIQLELSGKMTLRCEFLPGLARPLR